MVGLDGLPADHKGLPLAHVRVSMEGTTVTVFWSDCAHLEEVTRSSCDPLSDPMLISVSD